MVYRLCLLLTTQEKNQCMFIVAGFPLTACKMTGNPWHVDKFLVAYRITLNSPHHLKANERSCFKKSLSSGLPCPPALPYQKMVARTTAIGWFPGDSFLPLRQAHCPSSSYLPPPRSYAKICPQS